MVDSETPVLTKSQAKGARWRAANPGYGAAWRAAHPEYKAAWNAAHPGYNKAYGKAFLAARHTEKPSSPRIRVTVRSTQKPGRPRTPSTSAPPAAQNNPPRDPRSPDVVKPAKSEL
jgi:hypothetical protein